jgi:hypothetical protein
MEVLKMELVVLQHKLDQEFFPWVSERLEIQDDSQLKNASDLLGLGKSYAASIESARKEEKQPYLDAGREIDEAYKPLQNRLQLAVGLLDTAVLAYHRKLRIEADAARAAEAARIKAEEDAMIAVVMDNRARAAEATETGEVFVPAPIVFPESNIIASPGNIVRGNMGSTSIVTGYDFEIIDPAAVPRDCCSPDMRLIKAKYKYDGKPIPGVMITRRDRTVSRL